MAAVLLSLLCILIVMINSECGLSCGISKIVRSETIFAAKAEHSVKS